MKKTLCSLLAAGLLLCSLTACTESKDKPKSHTKSGEADTSVERDTRRDTSDIKKGDCNSVYAEVISVNGNRLTVSIGDRLLSLQVRTELLIDWNEGDQVILYYTGDFDDHIEVHYIDKWTPNSEVTRPEDLEKGKKDAADAKDPKATKEPKDAKDAERQQDSNEQKDTSIVTSF